MPTEAKRREVTELAELLRGSSAVAIADYRGLRVRDIQTVRRALHANGVAFRVAKNRLLKIAADEAGRSEIKPILEGPTAVATTSGDEAAMAKSVIDALRPYSRVVKLRGAVLGTRLIDPEGLQALSTLPPRDILLGKLAGGMQAPMAGLASVLAGNLRNLVGVLNAIAEKKGSAGGTAAGS